MLDLVCTCERYAKVGKEALKAKKAQMEKRASEEVQVFKDQLKIGGDTGEEILKELAGSGQGAGRLCTPASPKKVAMWIREEGCHPVIWHTVKEEYQFASELHAAAEVATQIFNSPPQSQLHSSAQKNRTWGLMLSASTNLEFPGASSSSARPRISSRG